MRYDQLIRSSVSELSGCMCPRLCTPDVRSGQMHLGQGLHGVNHVHMHQHNPQVVPALQLLNSVVYIVRLQQVKPGPAPLPPIQDEV